MSASRVQNKDERALPADAQRMKPLTLASLRAAMTHRRSEYGSSDPAYWMHSRACSVRHTS